jgi:hypothetical protein
MNWERHFREMNRKPRIVQNPANYSKEYSVGFGADFGAMQRGIPVPGQPVGTVVMPPGRYWLDTFGDKRKVFTDWLADKKEVHVETVEDEPDASPPHTFTIFTIPKGVNNFNLEGLWFPTIQLGFPEIAPITGANAVTTSDDTVQKPAVTRGIDGLLQTLGLEDGTTPPAPGKGWWPPSNATIVKFALIGGLTIAVATLPSALLKHAATKAL